MPLSRSWLRGETSSAVSSALLGAALLALPHAARAQLCDAEQLRIYNACWAGGYCSGECGSHEDMASSLGSCTVGGVRAVDRVSTCCDQEQLALMAPGSLCLTCGRACPVPETVALLGGCVSQGVAKADVLRAACDDLADCAVPFTHETNQSRTCWGAIGTGRSVRWRRT